MIERKWMVLRLDTDGVTIVKDCHSKEAAQHYIAGEMILGNVGYFDIKYGYPWEA